MHIYSFPLNIYWDGFPRAPSALLVPHIAVAAFLSPMGFWVSAPVVVHINTIPKPYSFSVLARVVSLEISLLPGEARVGDGV